MQPDAPVDEVVFDTRWFQLVARRAPAYDDLHYSIRTLDYVHIVAMNAAQELLLVRQFRPAVWETTIELPSGHVEPGQTPEQAARTELLEETGHEAEQFELLADLRPDTGRLGNRMWCFFAGEAAPARNREHKPEAGIDLVLFSGTLQELLREAGFHSALNYAALFAAVKRGKVKL